MKIFRYLTFEKFVSLLSKKSLFFTKAIEFEDKFEGIPPEAEIKILNDAYTQVIDRMSTLTKPEAKNHKIIIDFTSLDRDQTFTDSIKQNTYIISWVTREAESDALWKIYSKGRGVAIVTESTILQKELSSCSIGDKLINVVCDQVKYIDFTDPKAQYSNHRFLNKRNAFDFEHEYRAIFEFIPYRYKDPNEEKKAPILNLGSISENTYIRNQDTIEKITSYQITEKGIYIPIDVKAIIQQILVDPRAPKWFFDLVKDITQQFHIDPQKVSISKLS